MEPTTPLQGNKNNGNNDSKEITKKDVALIIGALSLVVPVVIYLNLLQNRIVALETTQAAYDEFQNKIDQQYETLLKQNNDIVQRLSRVEALLEK